MYSNNRQSSSLLEELIEAFQCLPGVGPRSATRSAFHLLERDRKGAERLANALTAAIQNIGHCEKCRNFSENQLCIICRDHKRDPSKVCVVETPTQLEILDQATHFRGFYHVLMGKISPLDGIGPEELGLNILEQRIIKENIQELILAISPTVEGEITAHYLSELGRALNIKVSRLAQGIPMGGELENLDADTLSHALTCRRDY